MAFRWDPEIYARFKDERLRPGFELMDRAGAGPSGDIVDLGCGAGEHAAELALRFPSRRVIGLDRSPEMLARARARDARVEWVETDLADWAPPAPPALIFSNAALHWVEGHEALIPRLFSMLAPEGVLAVQMPSNTASHAHRIAREICREQGWEAALEAMLRVDWVLPGQRYYDLMIGAGAREADIWETVYFHVLRHGGVSAWLTGTALRPILSALGEDEQALFLAEFEARTNEAYPPQADGSRLYTQRRLFLIARA